jgi:hypothetical protein
VTVCSRCGQANPEGFAFCGSCAAPLDGVADVQQQRKTVTVVFCWLEEKGSLVELDEIVGYHLEQAARYRSELGRPEPAFALRAGDRLLAAGQRALGREDDRAAAGLLERALALTRPLRLDVHAELDLAQAHVQESARAARIAEEAVLRAGEAGDETGAALARAIAAHCRLMVVPGLPDELEHSCSTRGDDSRRQRITWGSPASGPPSASA